MLDNPGADGTKGTNPSSEVFETVIEKVKEIFRKVRIDCRSRGKKVELLVVKEERILKAIQNRLKHKKLY